jgi:iron(III) transport system permease protein
MTAASPGLARPSRLSLGGLASGILGARRPPLLLVVLALVTAVFMTVPLIYVLYRGLSADPEIWQRLWETRLPELFTNTIKLVVAVSAGAAVTGVALAWLVVRTDLPGRSLFSWLAAMPLAVPPYVGALAYIALLGPGGYVEDWLSAITGVDGRDLPMPEFFGLGGAAFVLVIFTYPYVFLLAGAALRTSDRSLEVAAAAAGHGTLSTLRRVVLPLLTPAVGAGVLLVALYTLADFGEVSLMRYQTFTYAIYQQFTARFDRSAAAMLSSVLVVLTILLLWAQALSQSRRRYHQAGSSKPPRVVHLGRWRYPALAFVLLVMSLALFIPIGLLVYWTIDGLNDSSTVSQVWSYSDDSIYSYAWHSLWTSALAATIAVLAALPLALLATRFDSPASRWLSRFAQAGYALPGIVVALSVIFLLNRYFDALYGSTLVVVIAYVLLFYTQAHQAVMASLAQVPPAIEEAARSLGRRPERAFAEATLPLIVPGLVAGWALVFLTSLKELPATLLLRPAGFDTLPVRIWINSSEGVVALAAPLALVLIACASLPLYLLLRRSELGFRVLS